MCIASLCSLLPLLSSLFLSVLSLSLSHAHAHIHQRTLFIRFRGILQQYVSGLCDCLIVHLRHVPRTRLVECLISLHYISDIVFKLGLQGQKIRTKACKSRHFTGAAFFLNAPGERGRVRAHAREQPSTQSHMTFLTKKVDEPSSKISLIFSKSKTTFCWL